MIEPSIKRASFFIDGQNLFPGVKEAFGYPYPNYNIKKLSEKICEIHKWEIKDISFYTGIPDEKISPDWHYFWTTKMSVMGNMGIKTFSRKLQYSNVSNDRSDPILAGREKGIDIRIALDVTRTVFEDGCDVAIIFSQDQDLSEVAKEVRHISKREKRWIKIASAFPVSPTSKNNRGINNTDWIKIERKIYDDCIDTRDYRPKKGTK